MMDRGDRHTKARLRLLSPPTRSECLPATSANRLYGTPVVVVVVEDG